MAAGAFRECVPADNEFLALSDLEFDPGTAAPTAFVDRIWLFGDQALKAKLLGDPNQFISGAAEFPGEPDILRRFFNHLSKEFAPGAERLFAQILAL